MSIFSDFSWIFPCKFKPAQNSGVWAASFPCHCRLYCAMYFLLAASKPVDAHCQIHCEHFFRSEQSQLRNVFDSGLGNTRAHCRLFTPMYLTVTMYLTVAHGNYTERNVSRQWPHGKWRGIPDFHWPPPALLGFPCDIGVWYGISICDIEVSGNGISIGQHRSPPLHVCEQATPDRSLNAWLAVKANRHRSLPDWGKFWLLTNRDTLCWFAEWESANQATYIFFFDLCC